MPLFKELKRRNVVKVAIAYAATAWLLIQLAVTTFPVLNLPDWTVTLVTILMLIGFPLALIFAWAFELTPGGIQLEKNIDRSASTTTLTGRKLDFIIIGVLVVALGVFAFERFFLLPATAPTADSGPQIIATEIQQSIAVLPFVNMSSDPEQEYFSDGLSEEILNLLAKTPGLKVIGRTSSFAFKGKNEDLRIVGQTLGVDTVLEGSVRKSGDRVRITAQLIDAMDGTHIWSETYDRTIVDIFAVQDDVAAAIIDALQILVGTNPTRGRPTESPEAYALFLKARVFLDAQQGRDAIGLLQNATEIDPKFAEANELLAFSYWQQAGTSINMVEAQRLCNEAATKALAINPSLTFAQALYRLTGGDTPTSSTAIELLEQAWREQPSNSAPLRTLVFELTYRGYLREAHRFARLFVEQDPLSPVANYSLGESFVSLGQTSEAFQPLQIALELDNAFAQWFVPGLNLIAGRDQIAIAYYEAALQSAGISDTDWVGELITAARDPVTGEAYLDTRIPQIVAFLPEAHAANWETTMDFWYLLFGFLDHYYEIILAAEPNGELWTDADFLTWQGTIFRSVGFTAHPRYPEVAGLLGMFELWEQRGPPDFCEELNGRWVCE